MARPCRGGSGLDPTPLRSRSSKPRVAWHAPWRETPRGCESISSALFASRRSRAAPRHAAKRSQGSPWRQRCSAPIRRRRALKLAERSAQDAKELMGILPGHPPWGAEADAALAQVALAREDRSPRSPLPGRR